MINTARKNKVSKKYLNLVERFPLIEIKNDAHLKMALQVADELANREDLDDSEREYRNVLFLLIECYENANTQNLELSPVEMLSYLMKINGLKQADIAHLFGSKSILSEILSDKRQISKENASRLGKYFALPAAVFLPK
jgi:HTH-type transcriptional regulator/antitoxin HigA